MSTGFHFDEATHTYTLDGQVIPGVTSILNPVVDFSHIPPKVLEAKSRLGKAVHRACELECLAMLDDNTVHEQVYPFLMGFREFCSDKQIKVIATEQALYHPKYKYAGTMDLVCEFDGFEWLIDFKSTVVHYPHTGLQLAGYDGLRTANGHANPHRQRAALRLTKEGRYSLKRYSDKDDWMTFLSLLNVHNWRKRNGV